MRLLLFSGGVDSTALAYLLRPELLLTIDYGQLPAQGEIAAAREIADHLSLRHEIIRVDCSHLGRGQMAGMDLANSMEPEWWPYRNQLLVTIAAMKFEREGCREILLGTVSSDNAHCDGTQEFVDAIDSLLALQKPNVRVRAPAISRTSEELVEFSRVPREILGWAFSCHRGPVACGTCRGCTKTLDVFRKVGLILP